MYDAPCTCISSLMYINAVLALFYSLNFIYWVVTITVMLTALILGAQSREPTVYNTPEDYFRAVCEALMVLLITISAIRDLVLISV